MNINLTDFALDSRLPTTWAAIPTASIAPSVVTMSARAIRAASGISAAGGGCDATDGALVEYTIVPNSGS